MIKQEDEIYNSINEEEVQQQDLHDKKQDLKGFDKLFDLTEIGVNELSGDENDEKSCVKSSMHIFTDQNKKSNAFLSSITLMKTIVGTGLLGLPYVMMNFGLVFGCLLLIIFGIATLYTCYLMQRNKNISKHSNFCTIGRAAFGNPAKYIVNAAFILNNFGICMLELVIFGQTTTNLTKQYIQHDSDYNNSLIIHQEWFVIICVSVLILPLTYVKSIERLKYVSLFAMTSITLFMVTTIYSFGNQMSKRDNQKALGFAMFPENFNFTNAFSKLPTIILAFVCQMNYFPIYKTLENSTDRRMLYVTIGGLSFSGLLYLMVSGFGYATYGSLIKISFLESIKQEDIGQAPFIILNISFVISTTLSFPVLFYGMRNNIFSVLKDVREKLHELREQKKFQKTEADKPVDVSCLNIVEEVESPVINKFNGTITGYMFIAITTFIFIFVVTITILVGDLGPIFSFTGAIASNSINFIFPCTFYIKLAKKKDIHYYIAFNLLIILIIVAGIAMVCQVISE